MDFIFLDEIYYFTTQCSISGDRKEITLRKKSLGVHLNYPIKMSMYFWNIYLYFWGRNKSIHFESVVRVSVKSPFHALPTTPQWVFMDKGDEKELHPAPFRWASTPKMHFSWKSVSGVRVPKRGCWASHCCPCEPTPLRGPRPLLLQSQPRQCPLSYTGPQLHCRRSRTVGPSRPPASTTHCWTVNMLSLS